jgi:hypothetical protein
MTGFDAGNLSDFHYWSYGFVWAAANTRGRLGMRLEIGFP